MWLNKVFRLRSLKSRLALWVLFPLVLVIGIDLAVSFRGSDQIATLVQQQLLHGAAAMISEQLTLNEEEYEISVPPAAFDLLRNRLKDRVSYAIHDSAGQLIAGDDQLPPFKGEIGPEGEEFFLKPLRGETVRVIAYSFVIPNSPRSDFVITQVAQTLRNHNEFRDDLLHSTIRRHFNLLAITVFFLVIAFRWMLRPLVEFSASLSERQPGSLEKMDENEAPTELRPVIHAMNDYVQRLESTLKSYEKFVANTAHHLRNSFAVITTQINFAKRSSSADPVQQEVLGAAQKALGKCTRVINQLLMLASLEQSKKTAGHRECVSLVPVITGVIEELAPVALQREVELGVDVLDERAIVEAPARLLQELLTNLVGNAIQHMKKAGHVTVSVASGGNTVTLSVIDDGVGIPVELREKVFERFFRIDESNPDGSGLGMAIVKEICDSLGATIVLGAPVNGSGLQVDIRFPLAIR